MISRQHNKVLTEDLKRLCVTGDAACFYLFISSQNKEAEAFRTVSRMNFCIPSSRSFHLETRRSKKPNKRLTCDHVTVLPDEPFVSQRDTPANVSS